LNCRWHRIANSYRLRESQDVAAAKTGLLNRVVKNPASRAEY